MTNQIVVAIAAGGANEALRGLMTEYGDALTSIGLTVVYVTLDPAEMRYVVERMAAGQVSFGLTLQGIGQDLAVANPQGETSNAWDAFGIPLLKLHGDSPAYFADRHRSVPLTSINLYHASEFLEFRRRWLPRERTLAALIPPLPLDPLERTAIDPSVRRRGKFVFLKNGNSPGDLRRLWRESLPQSTGRLVEAMADEITPLGLKPGRLHVGDLVSEFLLANGFEPESVGDLLLFFSAQMDDYLRRVKSQMIAEAILDLPVIVQGTLWEHLNFAGRRALLVEGQDFHATRRVYSDQLGIIDMSANTDTWPHDRVQRAAGAFLPVLTNRQGWLTEGFPGCDDLCFEFTRDSIQSRVSEAIGHPDRYLELGVEFGERFRSVYPREAFAHRLVDMAELGAFQASRTKPIIQRFFIWPAR